MPPKKRADTILKMESMATKSIAPYANNAKVHPEPQVAQIVASIQKFGFIAPILINANNVIIAGHGRLAAAKELGMAKVPVIRLGHLTDDEARALRIADNSIAESGTRWDVDLLEAELDALRAVKFDLVPLGLDNIQLPEIEEIQPVPPKPHRNKTTLFISIRNEEVGKARKTIVAALDKARIPHNL